MRIWNLKELFVSFIRSRGFDRHFRRPIFSEMGRRMVAGREIPPNLVQMLAEASTRDPAKLLEKLESHHDGLTEAEAEFVRGRVGPNEIEHEKPLRWWEHLWYCYKNPFNLLLTVLAALSYYTEDMKATIVISTMVLISTLIRFVQEARSNKAADKLREMVSNTSTVMRRDPSENAAEDALKYFGVMIHQKEAHRAEVPIKMLVPGDMVLLSAGDMIPADVRILASKDLFISQAAMTGESIPVEKFSDNRHPGSKNPVEFDNIGFMGTNVVSGTARAVVISTGNQTYFGALATKVTAAEREPTSFQSGVNKVSWLMLRFMLVMTPIVLVLNGFTKHNWSDAFLFAIAIAIGLTPEMLPMIVTTTLAKGAVLLSRKKVIVKRLDAIQNFGAMDVLCTDKTGTLTQDKIFLERHTDSLGGDSDRVLQYAYLNSYYQTGLKNLLDVAVLEHADVHSELNVTANFRKVDEVPFDFKRRRMSVVVAEHEEHHLLICKGAVEEILAVCTHVQHGEDVQPVTPETLADLRSVTAALNEDGLRVVAVAARELPPTKDVYGIADEKDLTLIGYIAFLDPPKETTAPALTALREHGVEVKVLTGDNELVTAKICREVGLPMRGTVLGSDVETMTDAQLAQAVEANNVFAKLTPAHKERIVRALRGNGHVVGFMGDGINDAPALRAADIGISVDTAVDIAKEAADIILLEKSLMVLEEGVLEGRKTFVNMLKYIKMTASSNFGNVFSVLVASAFLPFLPMLPLQILVQNLLYDTSQVVIPFDNVDAEQLRAPQRWRPEDLGRFMLFFGPISSIFDITTYCVLWYVFGYNSLDQQSLFQSGWFIEGLLSQTLIVHMIRTRRIPFVQSIAAAPVLALTLAIILLGLAMPFTVLGAKLGMVPLPPRYFAWLALTLLSYCGLIQLMKRVYIRRYKRWL